MKKFIGAILVCGMLASMSFSAVYADEPMVISPAPAENEVIVGRQQITVNGEKVDLDKTNLSQYIYSKNGNIMVPLRAVAEKMGYVVEWNEEKQAVTVGNDIWEIILYIGDDSYVGVTKIKDAVGMTAPQSYGVAPEIVEDCTFVPAKMFELMDYKYSAVGQYVDFEKEDNSTQIPNPFTEYKSVEDAKAAVSFDAVLPTKLPDGYEFASASTMGSDFLQVFYKKGESEIMYRVAVGSGDISGDYNVYDITETEKIKDSKVELKGDENKCSLAVWNDNESAYSLNSEKGIEKAEMTQIIESVNFAEPKSITAEEESVSLTESKTEE